MQDAQWHILPRKPPIKMPPKKETSNTSTKSEPDLESDFNSAAPSTTIGIDLNAALVEEFDDLEMDFDTNDSSKTEDNFGIFGNSLSNSEESHIVLKKSPSFDAKSSVTLQDLVAAKTEKKENEFRDAELRERRYEAAKTRNSLYLSTHLDENLGEINDNGKELAGRRSTQQLSASSMQRKKKSSRKERLLSGDVNDICMQITDEDGREIMSHELENIFDPSDLSVIVKALRRTFGLSPSREFRDAIWSYSLMLAQKYEEKLYEVLEEDDDHHDQLEEGKEGTSSQEEDNKDLLKQRISPTQLHNNVDKECRLAALNLIFQEHDDPLIFSLGDIVDIFGEPASTSRKLAFLPDASHIKKLQQQSERNQHIENIVRVNSYFQAVLDHTESHLGVGEEDTPKSDLDDFSHELEDAETTQGKQFFLEDMDYLRALTHAPKIYKALETILGRFGIRRHNAAQHKNSESEEEDESLDCASPAEQIIRAVGFLLPQKLLPRLERFSLSTGNFQFQGGGVIMPGQGFGATDKLRIPTTMFPSEIGGSRGSLAKENRSEETSSWEAYAQ